MANPIKFSVFLLVAGLVAFASCEKPTPAPDPEPTVFADPANCFMVNAPGFYAFKANKGKTQEAVASIASVEVLWESFGTHEAPSKGNIIPQAYYQDGMVYFRTPETLKDGNAVIAAQDANHNILWSWHIWVCAGWDATATAQTYFNKSNGIASFGAVMDRNLGATSAAINDHKAHGLLYQWGRKDPFLGWDGYNAAGHTPAASTLEWPTPIETTAENGPEVGTVAYTIAHPTTLIYPGESSSNVDWYYTKEHNVTDNTRWHKDLPLYDPCPAGWTLPEAHTQNNQGLWYNALGNNWNVIYQYWDPTLLGVNMGTILGNYNTIWYPEVSFYYYEDGKLYRSRQVYVWSSTVTPLQEDGVPIFELTDGGSGGFTPETHSMDVTANAMYCGENLQHHTEAWAAMHAFRALALPTRCVAIK
jgi:hypothetical protein